MSNEGDTNLSSSDTTSININTNIEISDLKDNQLATIEKTLIDTNFDCNIKIENKNHSETNDQHLNYAKDRIKDKENCGNYKLIIDINNTNLSSSSSSSTQNKTNLFNDLFYWNKNKSLDVYFDLNNENTTDININELSTEPDCTNKYPIYLNQYEHDYYTRKQKLYDFIDNDDFDLKEKGSLSPGANKHVTKKYINKTPNKQLKEITVNTDTSDTNKRKTLNVNENSPNRQNSHPTLLSTPTRNSTQDLFGYSSLITTTRFLHHPVSPPSSASHSSNTQNLFSTDNTSTSSISSLSSASSSQLNPTSRLQANTKSVDEQTPPSSNNNNSTSLSNSASVPNGNGYSVVSRLKNWIKKPVQIVNKTEQETQQQQQSEQDPSRMTSYEKTPFLARLNSHSNEINNHSSSSSSSIMSSVSNNAPNNNNYKAGNGETYITPNGQSNNCSYNPPLSIDFVRKLKRPTNAPFSLEYSNAQVFQGSLLEDWLMSTLEDHILTAYQQQFNNCVKITPVSLNTTSNNDASTNTNPTFTTNLLINDPNGLNSNSLTSLPGILTTPSTATSSATSLVVDTISYSYIPNSTVNESENSEFKKLNSESYKTAIQNASESAFELSDSNTPSSNNTSSGYQSQSFNKLNNNSVGNSVGSNHSNCSSSNGGGGISANSLAFKRQEANFYVQQFLTNLLAIGVLEFESGFENAINKTFKVIFCLV